MLGAAAPHVRKLAELEAERARLRGGTRCDRQAAADGAAGMEQQQQGQGQGQQDAVEATKECMLAIGGFIEGGGHWLPGVSQADLWQVVVEATGHRMNREQLASLYRGIKRQHDCKQQQQQLHDVAELESCVQAEGVCPSRNAHGPAGVGAAEWQHRREASATQFTSAM
jgi:hypothetical protein